MSFLKDQVKWESFFLLKIFEFVEDEKYPFIGAEDD